MSSTPYISPRTLQLQKAAAAAAALSSGAPARATPNTQAAKPTRRTDLITPPAPRAAHNGDSPSEQVRLLTRLTDEQRAALIERLPALTRKNAQVLLYDRAACMRCGHRSIPAGSLFEVSPASGGVRCLACDADALIPLSWLQDCVSGLVREPATLSVDALDGLLIEAAALHFTQSLVERRVLIESFEARRAAHLPLSGRRLEVWRDTQPASEPPRRRR